MMMKRYLIVDSDVKALEISTEVAKTLGCGKNPDDVTCYWFHWHEIRDGRVVLHVDDRGAEKLNLVDRDMLLDSLSPEMRPEIETN